MSLEGLFSLHITSQFADFIIQGEVNDSEIHGLVFVASQRPRRIVLAYFQTPPVHYATILNTADSRLAQ
ncbi:hypothetical protein A7U60_g1823 [Sanghuangporus baumii]|uniref:Uncharacterized protein n=1 Tax=Sanghuangporus baumii TaxID=108892 RepID=A0A9Q5I3B3_SANBA|nr:hypothetical protein A7U60_g1823 [Sanghuangporus baumii]